MSATNHPWSRDVRRDEAIRAAEDAAAAERTPLPDHRDIPAAVAELRERVGRLENAIYRAGQFAAPEAQKGPNCTERESGLLDRLTAERDAAIRERDAAKEECGRLRHLLKTKESECETHHPWVHPSAAPAANAGGGARQEPVKYAVVVGGKTLNTVYDYFGEARCKASDIACRGTPHFVGVVALYAAPVAESATTPQPPRGWLTRHERWRLGEMVAWLKGRAAEHPDTIHGGLCESYAADIDALLARETPPKVKVPEAAFVMFDGESQTAVRDRMWIAAIREAGGEVEE